VTLLLEPSCNIVLSGKDKEMEQMNNTPAYKVEVKYADNPTYRPFDVAATFKTKKDLKPLAEWVGKFEEVNGDKISEAKIVENKINGKVIETY